MNKYASIETIWKRDNETNRLIPGALRQPTHEMIAMDQWVVMEKVDGTNIRVIYTHDSKTILGRTNKAQLQPALIDAIDDNTPSAAEVQEYFQLDPYRIVTLYGEGFGAGIQKVGGNYRADKGFILFDVHFTNTNMNTEYFLSWDNVNDIANNLDIPVVPELGSLSHFPQTRQDLLDVINHSFVAEEYAGKSDVLPEGIVCKPRYELTDQYGKRIMWKLTFRDLPE